MGTITFRVYPQLKLVHFQGVGNVSYDMIIESIQQLHVHPQWQFDFNSFIDFEDAEVLARLEDVEKYRDFFMDLQRTTPVRKWAIYTRNTQTHQNANMSHLLNSESIVVDVFQRRDEALKFLDVSPQQFNQNTKKESIS